MDTKVVNPHDRFFKAVLGDEKHAREFLELYLPQELVRQLDLNTLAITKDSFIEKELREYFSDLLYRVELKGQPAFIYLLFEHKSSPDKLTAFQVLRYMVKIWELVLKQGQFHTRLPIIVPLVIYHGRSPWNIDTGFKHLFHVPDGYFEAYVPDFEYLLYDISHFTDEEIKGAVILKASLLTMKYVFRPELGKQLEKIFGLFKDLTLKETGLEYLETLLRYLVNATDTIKKDDIARAIQSIPEGDKIMPTIAEQWKKEGFEEGIQQGIQQGIRQGIQEGIQQGIQQGIREGILEAIELGLKLKFGTRGLKIYPEIRKIEEVERLRSIKEAIEIAGSIKEIEELLD